MNIYSLARKFPTEEHALAHLMKVRWPGGIRCLKCDHDKCWLVESKNKTGKPRRLFQCAACKWQFSATTGTLFHDSHLPLTKWFASIALMADAKKGMSAMQLMRHVGMTYKTAWYVCHRIREAMREESNTKLGGNGVTVEIDETYIGGIRRRMDMRSVQLSKTLVIGMAERGGRIHFETIKDRTTKSIGPAIAANVDPDTTKYVTDGLSTYEFVLPRNKHEAGNHSEELKDKNSTSTQAIETAFSLFKRGIVGQYHWLSPWHLARYMGEFCWRFNRRGLQPWIFGMTLNNMVCRKPLPYKELTKF